MKTLYTTSISLPLGGLAIIRITEAEPASIPRTKATWPEEWDYPRVAVVVLLPCTIECPYELQTRLCQIGTGTCERIESGEYYRTDSPLLVSAARRSDAVDQGRRQAEAELAPIIAHLHAREARLGQRGRTLAAGVES